jgi:hypothetical protein
VKQTGENLVKISMNLPKDLWRQLKIKAAQADTTATDIVLKLCKEYIGRSKKRKSR